MWTSQATAASTQPAANQREEASTRALRSGRRRWIGSLVLAAAVLEQRGEVDQQSSEDSQPYAYLHGERHR